VPSSTIYCRECYTIFGQFCTVAAKIEKTNTSTRELLQALIRCGTTSPYKLCDSKRLCELIYEKAET